MGIQASGEKGKQFLVQAVEAFRNALEVYTLKNLPQDWAMTQNNLGIALKDQGIRTRGIEGTRLLAQAVEAYHNALEVRTRKDLPQQWAATQNNLGVVLSDQGIRTSGEEGTRLLAQAVEAYHNALEVRTRMDLPQDWAATQNNLCLVLSELGIRTGGKEGTQILAQAVEFCQKALQVRTRKELPQDWAATQTNLGFALRKQGNRTGGEEGTRLFTLAMEAYRKALEVRTLRDFPLDWAMTQNNLGIAYMALKDWPKAAACFVEVLEVLPDHEIAYKRAAFVYHEVLFDFSKAFELNKKWIAVHPDDLIAYIELAKTQFTNSQFAECEKNLVFLMSNDKVQSQQKITLFIIEIANLVALNRDDQIPNKMEILFNAIAKLPEDLKLTWSFSGIKYFISQNNKLASHREWLLQLFNAIEKEGREPILSALQEVQQKFGRMTK